MTPFGARVREIRERKGLSQQALAAQLGVSGAYLSALEHGRRGKPTFALVQGVIHALGVIWDEADELVRLAELSDPRVVIDTSGLDPEATLLANRLAAAIRDLERPALLTVLGALDAASRTPAQPPDDPDR
jgi:transcriptional regulator with XRE-family HTH domain